MTATIHPITAAAEIAPVRATWKQHGNPVKGFEFYGTEVKAPAAKPYKVSKCEMDGNTVVVKNGGGKEVARFGAATKFWAIVPEDAPRAESAAPAKADTTPKAPTKAQLAKEAREAKIAEQAAAAEQFGTFAVSDQPDNADEPFAVVMDDKHVVYTATNRRYCEVVSRALADGLAARVAAARA
jgi:hypothetical protein